VTSSPAPAFGPLLTRLRKAAGLTQATLAERARMSQRGLQDLERGVHQAPRRETIELLTTALGLAGQERAAFIAAAEAGPPLHDPAAPGLLATGAFVPLVGRERELGLLGRFLADANDGWGVVRVLLLAGEPGIGKTRLLQAVAQQAVPRGWCVLVGGCQRRGGQDPYAPLLEALAHHLHTQRPERRAAELAGCAQLVRLLPELRELPVPPAANMALAQERRLLDAAVARFLTNVAGPAGTLLLLDDLQWAGPDALDLLATLARGVAPVRIVGAYRDTEVRPAEPLGMFLADLAQAQQARLHTLGPLAMAEATMLLDSLLAGRTMVYHEIVGRVLERAGGIPFFLVSYAQALQAGATEAVPWDLGQGVRQRVALLPEAARQVLGAAAVAGRRVSRALLTATAGQAEEQVLAGLEEACRVRLLLEEGDDAYVFAHDVIREVVEADLGSARRSALHRRVAETLERAPASAAPELLAHHFTRAGSLEHAARYLEQAGDHAWATRAHSAAKRYYREALDRLERLGRSLDVLRLREKLAEVLKRTGRYAGALELLEPAAAHCRAAGDWEGLVRVTASIGEVYALRGSGDDGVARLRLLLEQVDDGVESHSLAAPYLWSAVLMFMSGSYEASLVAGERAAVLARAAGDERTLVRAAWNRANLLQMLGRLEEARQADEEVLPLAEALGDLECLVAVHRDLAFIHALRGAFVTSGRYLTRSLAVAEQMENPAQLSFTVAFHGWLALLTGDGQRARADMDRALAVSAQADPSWHSTYLPFFLARLSLAEGDPAGATALVQQALVLAEESSDLQALRWASALMAEIEMLERRPEAARIRLLPLLDRLGLEECDVTLLLPVLAWAQLELGQVDDATVTVEQAVVRARREEMQLVLVEALRVQALIAIHRERWIDAECSLAEGLALARAMLYPYAEARLLQVCGRLHSQKGEPEVARERLEAALATFRRLGVRMEVDLTERDLTRLPGAPPPAAAEQPTPPLPVRQDGAMAARTSGPLSRAERQAWALDCLRADGPLSPRAYAQALHVSIDTALLDLRALKERGLVRAEGTTKDRRYVLAGDDRRAGNSPNL
jgi:tetratricopeptide (TPR) repeat protein/transcriptional regulator with XRE-family HTH domain